MCGLPSHENENIKAMAATSISGLTKFYFPTYECETLEPLFSQQSAILSCRASAPPVGTACEWNAEVSAKLGSPVYRCIYAVNGTTLPTFSSEYPACILSLDGGGQVAQYACPTR